MGRRKPPMPTLPAKEALIIELLSSSGPRGEMYGLEIVAASPAFVVCWSVSTAGPGSVSSPMMSASAGWRTQRRCMRNIASVTCWS